MSGLLRAEAIKLTERRLPWVLAGVLVLITSVGALFQFAAADLFAGSDLEVLPVPEKPEAFLHGFQDAAGNTWVAVILAVVMLGGEFTRGTWAVSLTWESRRWAQLMAKLVVISVGATALALIGVVVWAVFAAGLAEGSGVPSAGELVVAVLKLGYTQLVWVAIGLAAVALIRSTGLAVGLAVGVSLLEGLLALWPAYSDFSLGGATAGIFGLELPVVVGETLTLPDPARSSVILLVWGTVAAVAAWAALTYRDA